MNVPPPPEAPTLSPTIATKTTTRLYGADPFEEAISVTQHIWPAALPENSPNLTPDRPRAVTLLTPDDPLTAITATPIIHFPDDAPVLYVTSSGVPANTLNEIKRLGPSGIDRYNNVQAFLVGAAANTGVENQLKSIGVKYVTVTAGSVPDLANKVDQLYGSIQNPDTGVPVMDNGMANVVIGSTDAYQYLLPATHWVAHMATGLFWVTKNSVPQATIDALKRRKGSGTHLPVRRPRPDLVVGREQARPVRVGDPGHERRQRRVQRAADGHAGGHRDRVLEDVGLGR